MVTKLNNLNTLCYNFIHAHGLNTSVKVSSEDVVIGEIYSTQSTSSRHKRFIFKLTGISNNGYASRLLAETYNKQFVKVYNSNIFNKSEYVLYTATVDEKSIFKKAEDDHR